MDCRGCRPLFQVLCCSSFLWMTGVVGHCIRSFAAIVFYGLQGLPATVSSPLLQQFSMDDRGCRPLYRILCHRSYLWMAGVAATVSDPLQPLVYMDCRGCRSLYQVLCSHSFLWIAGVAGHCFKSFATIVIYGLQGLKAIVSSPLSQ